MKYIDVILWSWKSVFTYDDIRTLVWIENKNTIKSFFTRWVKAGVFERIYKWIYGLKKYDILELWTKLKKQSYGSFETVLKKQQIIFQDYGNRLFFASDNTLTKTVWNTTFEYIKLKDDILFNPIWIKNTWNYMIASAERAICDRLYISADYYFDSLADINTEKLLEISQIYNKRVILAIKKLIDNAQSR